jgi:hypothetical protein
MMKTLILASTLAIIIACTANQRMHHELDNVDYCISHEKSIILFCAQECARRVNSGDVIIVPEACNSGTSSRPAAKIMSISRFEGYFVIKADHQISPAISSKTISQQSKPRFEISHDKPKRFRSSHSKASSKSPFFCSVAACTSQTCSHLRKRGTNAANTCICMSDNSGCYNVQFIFVSYIMRDGLGDAVGLARIIKMIEQIYPDAKFRVVIDDMYLGADRFNGADENSWPKGYRKFMEVIRGFGLDDKIINAVALDVVNGQEICTSILQTENALVFAGPSGSYSHICGGEFRNLIPILELSNTRKSFGLHPNGFGMPIPDRDEVSMIMSKPSFQAQQLYKLFEQLESPPLFAYMKNQARLMAYIKEATNFIGMDRTLDVLIFGYNQQRGDENLTDALCKVFKNVAYTTYGDGSRSANTCANSTFRKVNIHHFGNLDISQSDFMLAMRLSFDIVGTTGDQSYLEALAIGKIPVRDLAIHKIYFDSALMEFYRETVGADSDLVRFLDNVEKKSAVRQTVDSKRLADMKQQMKTIVERMRSGFDPLPRIRSRVEQEVSLIQQAVNL